MYWQLTLDAPYQLASQPGSGQTFHCSDFHAHYGSPLNKDDPPGINPFGATVIDPATGIVFLRPSCLNEPLQANYIPLSQQRVINKCWAPVRLAGQLSGFAWDPYQTLKRAEADNNDAFAIIHDRILEIVEEQTYDTLVWALESPVIDVNECWAFHYRFIADGLQKLKNWLFFAWDNIGIHLGMGGEMRVYRYDRQNLTTPPVLVDQFNIAFPGDFDRDGFFAFFPVPGKGIILWHIYNARQIDHQESSGRRVTPRSRLIPWSGTVDQTGIEHVTEASSILLAANPGRRPGSSFYQPNLVFGIERIRFGQGDLPNTGYFYDAPYAPLYAVTAPPSQLTPVYAKPNAGVSVACTIWDRSGVNSWVPGTNFEYRIKYALSSTDFEYTPFLEGGMVQWAPVSEIAVVTTPLQLQFASDGTPHADRLTGLEWAVNEFGRTEGKATAILDSDRGRAIAERGDSMFTLETSPDGSSWEHLGGGFAIDWQIVPIEGPGLKTTYHADFVLADMWHRFDEVHLHYLVHWDANSVATAINNVVLASGFGAVDPMPDFLTKKLLPPILKDNNWQLQPREGDSGKTLLNTALLLGAAQYLEWMLYYDWPSHKWVCEPRPYDMNHLTGIPGTSTWTLTPQTNAEVGGGKTWAYRWGQPLHPAPPENTQFFVEGSATDGMYRQRIVSQPIRNIDAETTQDSPDFVGRSILGLWSAVPLTDQNSINTLARRIADCSMHRRWQGTLDCPRYNPGLAPNTPLKLTNNNGDQVGPALWIKRSIVGVDPPGPGGGSARETLTLEVDSVWESPVG